MIRFKKKLSWSFCTDSQNHRIYTNFSLHWQEWKMLFSFHWDQWTTDSDWLSYWIQYYKYHEMRFLQFCLPFSWDLRYFFPISQAFDRDLRFFRSDLHYFLWVRETVSTTLKLKNYINLFKILYKVLYRKIIPSTVFFRFSCVSVK